MALEAIENTAIDTTDAIDTSTADTGEQSADAGAVDTGTEVNAQTATENVDVKGDERTLPAWIKNLKAADPQAFREAKNNYFGQKELHAKYKDLDADKLRPWLEESGGIEGIQGRIEELAQAQQQLQTMQEDIAAGNPKLIEDLAASSPEAISQLAPAMMEKYAQTDAEGYNATLSQIFSATINSGGIPMHLERQEMLLGFLADAVGDNPRALQILQQVSQGVSGLKQWTGAFAQVQAPQRQPGMQKPGAKDGAQAWQQEKAQFEQKQYQTSLEKDAVEPTRQKEINDQLAAFVAKDPKNGDKKELAVAQIRQQVLERMNANKDFVSKVSAFHSRRDAQGAANLIASREKAVIAEITQKVGRTIYGSLAAAARVEAKQDVKARTSAPTSRAGNRFDEIWSSAR